jgi:hypothetical protein
MSVLVNDDWGFSVHLPAGWFETEGAATSVFAVGDANGNSITATASIIDPEQPGNSLEETADLFEQLYPSQIGVADLLSRTNVKTAQGVNGVRMEWSIFNGIARQSFLMVIDSDISTGLVASATAEDYDALKEIFDHVLQSLATR